MLAVFLAVLVNAAPVESPYPLAAVFVVHGHIVLTDLHEKTAVVLETPGLQPIEADLSPDRKLVIFTASPGAAEQPVLYRLTVSDKTAERINTGIKAIHRQPKFTANGKAVIFSAGQDEHSGPTSPTRIRRLDLKTGITTQVTPVGESLCEFSPAPLGDDILHVGTDCFATFEVRLLNGKTRKSKAISKVTSPAVEIATSFDGKTAVYVTQTMVGANIFRVKDGKAELLTTQDSNGLSIQPKFSCPRDVMFLAGTQVRVLNTKSGEVNDVVEVRGAP
jgi:hypothetical protein